MVDVKQMEIDHEEVLEYWFGHDSKTLSARRSDLWFVNDEIRRSQVDEEIRGKFGELLQDNGLERRWGHGKASAREVLALVIVLDQFSRHVYRGGDGARIEACTEKAAESCRAALRRGLDHHLQTAHLCFLLMPLRHLVTYRKRDGRLYEAREIMSLLETTIVSREENDRVQQTILERFATATDRRSLIGKSSSEELLKFKHEDILEHADYTPKSPLNLLPKSPIYRAVVEFLRTRVPTDATENPWKLFISLSGGVDSMAIARILAHIAETNGACFQGVVMSSSSSSRKRSTNEIYRKKPKRMRKDNDGGNSTSEDSTKQNRKELEEEGKLKIEVHAIHIDYGNRDESAAEASFVENWCQTHGIIFHKRRIDEVTRGVTARDEYERESRRIRYETYKEVMQDSMVHAGMMFGHHHGDIIENVISNLMKGCSIMELSGMTPESVVEGVKVWRPLLNYRKEDVYDLAHTFGVPYFKDTTPKWSTRGKLRDRLLPVLAGTYGTGFQHNVANMASQSDQLKSLLDQEMFQPFLENVVYGKVAIVMPLEGFMDYPSMFWRYALRTVCHNIGIGAVKERAVAILTNILNTRQLTTKTNANCKWIVLKKEHLSCIFLVEKTLVMYLLDSDFAPLFKEHEKTIFKPGEGPYILGNMYSIDIQPINANKSSSAADDEDALDVMNWFETGRLSYALPWASEYQLCKKIGKDIDFFTKIDRKIRTSIPIINVVMVEKQTLASSDAKVLITITKK